MPGRTRPTKDFDPENAFFNDDNHTPEHASDASSDSEVEMDGSSGREHYTSVGKSKLRDLDLGGEVEEKKYSGRRVGRRDLYESDDDEEEEDSELDEGDSDDDDDDDELEGLEEDEDEDEIFGDEDNSDMDADSNDNDEDNEEDDDDFSENDNTPLPSHSKSTLDTLASLNQSSSEISKSITATKVEDAEKGLHVRHQMALYDGLLDTRIRLQKMLNVTNCLPKTPVFDGFVNEAYDEDEEVLVRDAQTELLDLLTDLLELQQITIQTNENLNNAHPDLVSTTENALEQLKKRKRDNSEEEEESESDSDSSESDQDTLWTTLAAFHNTYEPYRNEVIEKWGSKVAVASGGAGLVNAKKFKVLNATPVTQIKTILADKDRLRKRTRVVRGDYTVLGKPFINSSQQNAPVSDAIQPESTEEQEPAGIFDDQDFYSTLLRDLIESRMSSSNADDPIAIAQKWVALKQLQQKTKKKKNVDRKASKGRKVRYHVIEKLQSFMAPQPMPIRADQEWEEEMRETLFKSLFGAAAAQQPSNVEGGVKTVGGLRIVA